MLRYENQVPKDLLTDGVVVRTVGELIEQLSRLPSEMRVDGDMCNGIYLVRVVEAMFFNPDKPDRLVAVVEGFDCDDDYDEDGDLDY